MAYGLVRGWRPERRSRLLSAAIGEGDRASGTPLDAGDPGDTARSHARILEPNLARHSSNGKPRQAGAEIDGSGHRCARVTRL